MQTLNQIAENIAYKLGDQFNQTLKISIKDTILNYRAKFIRDDLDRNFLSDIHFTQVGTIQFNIVNILTEFGADYSELLSIFPSALDKDEYKVLKSKNPIPLPIRRKSSNRNPYSFIGTSTGIKRFVYTTLDKFIYIKDLPYTESVIYYTIINNSLYIINNLVMCDINNTLNICNVLIKDVFENPSEFYNACENGNIFIDDMNFPIGKDMLVQISNGIIRGEYPLIPKDGQEVNIKKDDND